MKNKESFDDMLKSKLADQQFPFDEENWEQAEEMIISHRRKEKWRMVVFIFFSGLVVGILLMLPFVMNENDEFAKVIVQTNEKRNDKTERIKEMASKQDVFNAKEGKEGALGYAQGAAGQIGVGPFSTLEIDERILKRRSPKSFSSAPESMADKSLVSDKEEFRERSIPESFEEANEGLALSNEDMQSNPASEETVLEKDSLITALDSLTENSVDSVLVKADSIPALDTVNVFALNVDSTDLNSNKQAPKPMKITAFIGGNVFKDFSLSPYQGLQLVKPLTEKVALGLGASYTYLSMDTGAVKTIVTNTIYDFGYSSDITEIKTSKLHYMVFPVFAQLNINSNNTLILGVNNHLLFTVSNQYTTYIESDGDKANSSTKKTFGYSSGINSYDMGLLIGYDRRLFSNLSIGIHLNYGFTDIKKDDYYNNVNFDRNISGQLLLLYQLR